jgi:hypothetical protein
VSRGGAKRRLRIRRKRKDGTGLGDAADGAAEFGCCLFEVVAAATVFVGLLLIPVGLLVG